MPTDTLRSPTDIIKVTDSIAEARQFLEPLASREIGAICIKGAAEAPVRHYLKSGSELKSFATLATSLSEGESFFGCQLEMRRGPRPKESDSHGQVTIFSSDTGMHFDGIFEEVFDDSGELALLMSWQPLIRRQHYGGVNHHITMVGRTTFVMERLTSNKARTLARNQQRDYFGVTDSSPLNMSLRGEAVQLEAGDYLALHASAVYNHPVYVHGTTNSSADRKSIGYSPFSKVSDYIIDSLEYPYKLELIDQPVDNISQLPNKIVEL